MSTIEVSTDFIKKCNETYSSYIISNGEERVQGMIEMNGKNYVCTGTLFSDGIKECYMAEVVEARFFDGEPHKYDDHDWNAERNYHGIRFKRRGSLWVFLRNKITLIPSSAQAAPKKQASLLDFAA